MNGLNLLYFVSASILIALIVCAYLLKRILNILRQWNNGEPTQDDLNAIEFSRMKLKE